jgi:hypothetical protein
VTRGTAGALRLGYSKPALISDREATMAGPVILAKNSTEPTTRSGFFGRLLNRFYNAFIERALCRFAPTRADTMIE